MTGSGRRGPGGAPKLAELTRFEAVVGRGWKRRLPGGRPLATPAVVDGRAFVGGGFGSHEFYAFNLSDGGLEWFYRTADDGPTAAAVAEGFVAFNTESCELEVLTVEGIPAWKRWLGDPLMSMPANADAELCPGVPVPNGGRCTLCAPRRVPRQR